jgi:hypothetical protein
MAFTYDQMRGLITAHMNIAQKEAREFDLYIRAYLSEFYSAEQKGETDVGLEDLEPTAEVNFLFPHVDQMVASVVPTNPMVNVKPKKEAKAEAARAREALINDNFKRQEMHRKCWSLARRASIMRQALLKATWDERCRGPRFRVLTPKTVWYDPNAEDWDDLRYVIEMVVLPKEEFERRVKKRGPGNEQARYPAKVTKQVQVEGYPAWLKGDPEKSSNGLETARSVLEYYVIFEFWDLSEPQSRFYHIHLNADSPLFAGDSPYRWLRNPYRSLTFIDNLEDARGAADAKLVFPAIEQMNNLDSLRLQHALRTVPVTLVDGSKIQNADDLTDALTDVDTAGAFVKVDMLDNGLPLASALYTPAAPSLSPDFERSRATLDGSIQRTLAIAPFARGEIGHAVVATEAALADSNLRTRAGFRQKEVFDVVGWAAKASIALYMEFLEPGEQVFARLMDTDEYLTLDREVLEFPIAAADPDGVEYFRDAQGNVIAPEDDELSFDYDVTVYSPAEQTKQTKLKAINDSFPVLQQMIGAGMVDPDKFASFYLDLLDMRHVKAARQAGMQGAQDMTAVGAALQGGQGGPAQPSVSGDTIATGALPDGTEVPISPTSEGGPGAGKKAPAAQVPAGAPNRNAMMGGLS